MEESEDDQGPDTVGYVSTVARDRLCSPSGIAMLSDDSILVADWRKHCIWRVDSSQGGVTIFAGTPGWQGFKDGCVDQARFRFPVGLCTEGPSVFVTDNSGIRQIAGGIVSTIFGKLSYSDHEPDSFGSLTGVALMPCGDIVIADNYPSGSTVCSIGCERQVTTVAGHKQRWNDPVKQSEWSCKDAQFSSLQQIAVGNDGSIYVTDCGNKRLKKIANGKVKTILQSSSSFQGVAIDTDGNLFVSESGTNKIFKWMPSGEVHVLCGSGKEESRDGHGVSASLKGPCYLYYDAKSGCLFFTEERAIRKVKVSEKRHHIDPKLPHDLLKLIDSSDIPSAEAASFLVEGKIVRVAKTSLCIRSEYFQKMLQSDWKESQTEESGNAITVRETTYDAFHAVITFLVAGVFDKEKCHSIMMDVLLLADKYLVADLREICMRQLVKQLSLTTVIEFLRLSEKHGFDLLLDASLTFAAENIKLLRHQDSFDSLSKDIVSKVVLSL